ncbi:MAG: tetratricopeptide repeat protein [Acidobacteriota bacterium]
MDGYIAEGKALFDQGRYQEAIDTWSRVFIVDEESREAQDLIDKAKAGLEQSQGEWQTSLTEGIAAYTAGDLAKAEGLFQKVLERFPENSEAQYYLSRIRGQGVPASVPAAPAEAPPGPSPAAPAQTGSETPPEPSGFEFEDDAPAPGKFEFESGTPEPPKAEAPPAPPGPVPSQPPPPPPGRFEQTEGGDEEFVLERGGEDATPPDAPAGSGSSPRPREDSSWDDIAPPPPGFGAESGQGAAAPGPPPPPPPAPGSEAGGAAMPPGKKPAVRKKVIGVGVGIAAVAVIAVIGAVIFWLTFSSNSGAGTAPSVPVSSVGRHKPKIKPKPKPKAPAPSAEQNPNGAQAEPAQPKPMTVDELLAAGKAAEGKKDYRKAAELYREALAKDALNTKAQNALASAQEAYEKQQEEARRNKAFLEKYQKSTQAFQDKDWADCLRQAWRLIYPDDTLASQLGKRKSIHDLIRDGYYNWAVQDLKAQNIQGAVKHLNDLLEFDGSDGQAKKLKAFAERYTKMPPDDIYADTVQALTYRTLPEEP